MGGSRTICIPSLTPGNEGFRQQITMYWRSRVQATDVVLRLLDFRFRFLVDTLVRAHLWREVDSRLSIKNILRVRRPRYFITQGMTLKSAARDSWTSKRSISQFGISNFKYGTSKISFQWIEDLIHCLNIEQWWTDSYILDTFRITLPQTK